MSVSEFAEKVREAAQDILGSEYYVEAHENTKLNNVKRWSVTIHSKNLNISPVIYMDSFYADYEEGKCFGEIMNDIMKFYWEYVPKVDFDIKKIQNFKRVKNKVCIKLCNTERNKSLLEEAVHIDFNDLSVLFYIELEDEAWGCGHVTIKNKLLDEWGVGSEELMKYAMKNTLERHPPVLRTMSEFFESYYRGKKPYIDVLKQQKLEADLFDSDYMKEIDRSLFVLSNKQFDEGAVCMLYPNVIKEFSESINSNLFIIPSSVHELLLVPEDRMVNEFNVREEVVEYLKSMIAFVNDSELSESDFLSYNLYYFDREKRNIVAV